MTSVAGLRKAGTWAAMAWLASACSAQGVRPTAIMSAADSADQVLLKMDTYITADGVRRSYVVAETAYVYQAIQKMDLRQMKATFFDAQGNQTSVLTSRTGIYTITTGSLDARGGVVVISSEGRKLTTEHLIYDKTQNQIKSDTAFVFDSKTEHLKGISFLTDPDFKNTSIDRPKGQQRGKGVLLPGQN